MSLLFRTWNKFKSLKPRRTSVDENWKGERAKRVKFFNEIRVTFTFKYLQISNMKYEDEPVVVVQPSSEAKWGETKRRFFFPSYIHKCDGTSFVRQSRTGSASLIPSRQTQTYQKPSRESNQMRVNLFNKECTTFLRRGTIFPQKNWYDDMTPSERLQQQRSVQAFLLIWSEYSWGNTLVQGEDFDVCVGGCRIALVWYALKIDRQANGGGLEWGGKCIPKRIQVTSNICSITKY